LTATLRDARPDDAPALAAILRAWLDETPWMPKLHTPDEDRAFLRNLIHTQTVRVAETDAPLAFLAMDRGLIGALYVAPTARNTGLGARLIQDAQTREPHLTCWCFQANLAAQRFYLRHGFTTARETDGALNEENLPDLCLVWSRPKDAAHD
jgi:GNAT superfamily N-acetyltransferase